MSALLSAYARYWGVLVLCLCVSLTASVPAYASDADAREFVQKIGNQVLDIIDDTSMTNAEKEDRLVNVFDGVVDVDWIGRFVLGKYWRQASEEQKNTYQTLYRPFLLRGYAARFTDYQAQGGDGFTITASRPLKDDEYQIDSVIRRTNGQAPVAVSYRVRKSGDGYKLFDVIIEGVSQLATQRSEFGAVASRQGIDMLLERLKTRVEALQG